MSKFNISIDTPKQIKSERVKNKLKKLIFSGVKTNEIYLICNFICDDFSYILNEFRIIKNKIAIERDLKKQGYV